MVSENFYERISDDWLWREKELREADARLIKSKAVIEVKSSILIAYSHWEGHFKCCASELLGFISEGIKRKLFKWTDIRAEVRERILFCSYRRSSLAGQNQETFITYLNALNDGRYADALRARDEIIMIDDNLSAMRAEAICRNLGVEHSWCALKKVVIDERILEYRNAIAHGARRLRSGDEMDLSGPDIIEAIDETRSLMREAKNRFQNTINNRTFLKT
jgi:RiboL-PSP-HEPN